MAGAKKGKQAKLAIDVKAQRKLLGKKIMLFAMGDPYVCPVCGSSKKKGMISEYNGVSYCSETCVVTVAESSGA